MSTCEHISSYNEPPAVFNCKLCSQFVYNEPNNLFQQMLGEPDLHIIREFEYFIWGIGLGQIVPGYTLLLPKRHICSLTVLTKEEQQEFLSILEQVILPATQEIYGCFPVVFEHGSSDDCFDKAGGCIDHAHLHLFPVNKNIRPYIDPLFESEELPGISGIFNKTSPYLFYANLNEQQYYFYNNIYNIQSQFLRMALKEATGSKVHWNWQAYAGIEDMRQTALQYAQCLSK